MTGWVAVDDPWPGHTRAGSGPSVVLLHGFTQTGRSWDSIADLLDDDIALVAPDAPGHGRSSDRHSSVAEYAQALTASLVPSLYVGYSMGGRTALHAALARPEKVRGLVLIGATPGIESDAERRARRDSDERLADRLETMPLDTFLEEWLTQPLFESLPRNEWNLTDRRRNSTSGLASSLRRAGTGTQASLWNHLAEIGCPVFLVTGGRDAKFTAIAQRMRLEIGASCEHVVVPNRGHAVHLEDPGFVASLISDVARSTA